MDFPLELDLATNIHLWWAPFSKIAEFPISNIYCHLPYARIRRGDGKAWIPPRPDGKAGVPGAPNIYSWQVMGLER